MNRRVLSITKNEVWPIYKLQKEQVEIIAANKLSKIKCYFSAKNILLDAFQDEKGGYFEFEVYSDRRKSNLMKSAACILQEK